MESTLKRSLILFSCTLAFFVCVAAWTAHAVLVPFLLTHEVFLFSKIEIGLLFAFPMLSGALSRIPFGLLAEKYSPRALFPLIMVAAALFLFLESGATSLSHFLLLGLGFGITGGTFSVGIAYLYSCFPKEQQGFAAGTFTFGGTGVALTTVYGPKLLKFFTENGQEIGNWVYLPQCYAALLLLTALLFFLLTFPVERKENKEPFREKVQLLKKDRVWRFGLYYIFSFGGFIALSQWLVIYLISAYQLTLAEAGVYAALFSIPSSFIRIIGGYLVDKFGPRRVMFLVFGFSCLILLFLTVPQMELTTLGRGITSSETGKVSFVSNEKITVTTTKEKQVTHVLTEKPDMHTVYPKTEEHYFLPQFHYWHEALVKEGDEIKKNQLLAQGLTHIYYQANIYVFMTLVIALGLLMGVGIVGVFKYIPDFFPQHFGSVGGFVGSLGALGGFFFPLLFSFLLEYTRLWTSCWLLLCFLAAACYIWLQHIVRKAMLSNDEPQ